VSPYPYPDTGNLPTLDGRGFWHTQHWVGAVLQASQFTENASAQTQQHQVATFLHSAVKASITLLKFESSANNINRSLGAMEKIFWKSKRAAMDNDYMIQVLNSCLLDPTLDSSDSLCKA
jgi:hypothetical protein